MFGERRSPATGLVGKEKVKTDIDDVNKILSSIPKPAKPGSLRRMVQWLRQRTCSHEGYIENIYRLYVGQVACPCNKCGKVLVAEYGLALPIKWMTKPLNAALCEVADKARPN